MLSTIPVWEQGRDDKIEKLENRIQELESIIEGGSDDGKIHVDLTLSRVDALDLEDAAYHLFRDAMNHGVHYHDRKLYGILADAIHKAL